MATTLPVNLCFYCSGSTEYLDLPTSSHLLLYSFALLFSQYCGPHEASLRSLHTVPVTSLEMSALLPQPKHKAIADCFTSPFVTFNTLCVSGASGPCSAIYFFLTVFPAQASHIWK